MKLLPYLAIVLGIWMLGGTVLLFAKRLPPLLLLVPLIFLTGALFSNGLLSFSAVCGGLFLTVYVLNKRFLLSRLSLVLLALIAGSLLIDMLTGSHLMQRNLLGYSAIEGARYYGIGNEAMGVLIGALLVLAARLWKPDSKYPRGDSDWAGRDQSPAGFGERRRQSRRSACLTSCLWHTWIYTTGRTLVRAGWAGHGS